MLVHAWLWRYGRGGCLGTGHKDGQTSSAVTGSTGNPSFCWRTRSFGRRFRSCHSDQKRQRVSASRLWRPMNSLPSCGLRPIAALLLCPLRLITLRLKADGPTKIDGHRPRRVYRRPKKLNIAITMTTAPTSQMILFMIVLLLPGEARASGGVCGPTSLCAG